MPSRFPDSIAEVLAELREALEQQRLHHGRSGTNHHPGPARHPAVRRPTQNHPSSNRAEIDRALAEIQVRELGGKVRIDSD